MKQSKFNIDRKWYLNSIIDFSGLRLVYHIHYEKISIRFIEILVIDVLRTGEQVK